MEGGRSRSGGRQEQKWREVYRWSNIVEVSVLSYGGWKNSGRMEGGR